MQEIYIYKEIPQKRAFDKGIIVILGLILVIFLVGIFAKNLAPHQPNETAPKISLKSPNLSYPFGTDGYGRCVFSRVIVGINSSLIPAMILVAISAIVGTFIGLISGYFGGLIDAILMRITDLILSFPQLLLAIFIAGVMGGGIENAVFALGVVAWTGYARMVRSLSISTKEELFIKAAKISGCGSFRIMFFHILPNIFSIILVTMSLQISTMMIWLAGLSFLGLGSALPQAQWGSMISENISYIQLAPWATLSPCFGVIICAVLFNLLGDKLRDQFSK